MKRLDPLRAPLEALTLIEANAGTGKTWTITALYLRLLLEGPHAVDSILVVTFTDIATAELRDRIRSRLVQARIAFENKEAPSDDAFLAGLVQRVANAEEAVDRLAAALVGFDQAPIYTIHGFCQRVLGDRAFESLMPFETRLVPDESLLLQEIADDFWRRSLYEASSLFVRYVMQAGLTPEVLKNELNGRVGKPYLEIRKPLAPRDMPDLEHAYKQAYAGARGLWLAEHDRIEAQLMRNADLSGSSYRRDYLAGWLQSMSLCLRAERPHLALFERFEKFTNDALRRGTRKGGTPPSHPFYDACDSLLSAHADLHAAYEMRLALLRAELIEYCNEELASRKKRRGLQSYDDLLLNLERALRSEGGTRLAAALRARYRAALIDEFQDTDPVQYRIFRAIYQGSGLAAFLVGDPKQSIYSFRGADVYAYLRARGDAQHRHTLDVNWRSQRPLLQAVNLVFDGKAAPFVSGEIPFRASLAARGNRGKCTIDGESGAPFEFWLIPSDSGKPLDKDDAARLSAQATASEIARLMRLGHERRASITMPRDGRMEEHSLGGGDIAVLVRTHRQAQLVRDALRALGIASVDRGGSSVFASAEADELQRVLMAVAEPAREVLVRAAMVTEMMGYSGMEFHTTLHDETRWEPVVETFRLAHIDWRDHGFIRMARAFLHRYGVVERLLQYGDGERRVTNLFHLIELIHREAGQCGISAALEWLAEKRRAPGRGIEEELLRLESDENLVKILTVHVAKGLEFPLVFCPFLWDGRAPSARDTAISYHDPARDYAAVLDLGSETMEHYRPLAQRERLAEDVRLLYVALTRARFRCWMVWGHIKDAGHAAPAWLLHGSGTPDAPIPVPLSDATIERDLRRIEARAEGSIKVQQLTGLAGTRYSSAEGQLPLLAPRTFAGTIGDSWRITSFSALAHARAAESPDYDGAVLAPGEETAGSAQDMHAFPRGARAGRCLHAIFQAIDFAGYSRADGQRIASRELAAHDFPSKWVAAVADMVERVIHTPLDETRQLHLADVTRKRRFDELEFYYPIANLTDASLRALLLVSGFPDEIRQRIDALTFAPAHGYMKGYIDLVFEMDGRFYLADYKSNWLGATQEAYRSGELRKTMAREAYYLQYLIYCVALHRYLKSRIPGYDYEARFGGVRYLFLRGMSPESGVTCGVYVDRPDPLLIDKLDSLLGGRP
jgi:exodeoxyribonuclease V beta subunit